MVGSTIEIDLAALRYNFSKVRELVGPSTAVLGVVKSDAYGHGMLPVARELENLDVDYLGVSNCREAVILRQGGLKTPILLLLGIEEDELAQVIQHNLTPTIYRSDVAMAVSAAALAAKTKISVHLKIDTGMGRLGVPFAEAPGFLELIKSLEGIRVEGLLSHFASADEHDKSFSKAQLERFRRILTQAQTLGLNPRYAHIANSAGVIDLPDSYLQLVRPGLMLYGAPPSQELHHPIPLKPVMSLKTRVLQLKEVPAGSAIGYGCTYTTSRPSRIATLPVGYDDGYDRLLSNKGEVLVRNRRAPVVGRISMCLTTVDVTDIPEVQPDDEVVLLGKQGEEQITADDIAAKISTINYEIFCNLGGYRQKVFLNSFDPEQS
ncbi:MAG: alanine racemase [Deltaproteobacteria bacterium]|nr:alanine racemase [Deltaproteobacteria bacterium]